MALVGIYQNLLNCLPQLIYFGQTKPYILLCIGLKISPVSSIGTVRIAYVRCGFVLAAHIFLEIIWINGLLDPNYSKFSKSTSLFFSLTNAVVI